MRTLHEQLENPLTKERNNQIRGRLAAAFPPLQSCTDQRFMALRCYLDSRPEKFFDKVAYSTHLRWLIDKVLDSNDYERARFIDRHVHPIYLRLIEAVLAPLSTPVAFFSRLARNKSTDGLDVWSAMQELKKFGAACYVRHYRPVIRNGIAHGGITFLQNAIRYRDKKGNRDTAVPLEPYENGPGTTLCWYDGFVKTDRKHRGPWPTMIPYSRRYSSSYRDMSSRASHASTSRVGCRGA